MKKLAALAALSALAAACYVESDPAPSRSRAGIPTDPAPTPSGSSTGATSNAPAPVLVEIDTDQTLNADPGKGVGVFVEYQKGGGWHVWWTCDTARSNRSCAFTVEASVAEGTIGGVKTENLAPQSAVLAGSLKVSTTTANEIHGVSFQAPAGAVLTLSAKVDAVADGSFVFFVQDGKVNGGYTGKLTNPVQFVGKTP